LADVAGSHALAGPRRVVRRVRRPRLRPLPHPPAPAGCHCRRDQFDGRRRFCPPHLGSRSNPGPLADPGIGRDCRQQSGLPRLRLSALIRSRGPWSRPGAVSSRLCGALEGPSDVRRLRLVSGQALVYLGSLRRSQRGCWSVGRGCGLRPGAGPKAAIRLDTASSRRSSRAPMTDRQRARSSSGRSLSRSRARPS